MAKEKSDKTIKETPTIGTRKDLFAAEEQRRAILRYLTPDVIDPNPDQPRQTIQREALEELKKSIAERGILQPLLAVKGTEGHVTLVAGQRRLLAARELGLKLVPVMVIDDRPDVAFDAIIENIQREPLDPIDEGEAFQRLAEERNFSHAEIGSRIGKSKQYVTDRVRLAQRLTPRTREMLTAIVQTSETKLNARAFNSEINNEEVVQGVSRAKFSIARAISFLPEGLQEAALVELESEVTTLGRRLTTREVDEIIAHFKAERPVADTHRSRSAASGIELVQMSFIGEAHAPVAPARKGRGRSKAAMRQVDGRQLESFKALADLARLPANQTLSLDLDSTIKMMEADLERLRRLKNEGQGE